MADTHRNTKQPKPVEPERKNPPGMLRDEPLSDRARAALKAGLESAKRGEIAPWGDFTKYADDED